MHAAIMKPSASISNHASEMRDPVSQANRSAIARTTLPVAIMLYLPDLTTAKNAFCFYYQFGILIHSGSIRPVVLEVAEYRITLNFNIPGGWDE